MSAARNLYTGFARHFPAADAPFLGAEEGWVHTYGSLDRNTARLAGVLRARGLRPGDRLTVQAGKCPEYLWLYLACLRAGAVFHPLNPDYTPAEVDYFIADAAPALLVGDARTAAPLARLGAARNVAATTLAEMLADAGTRPDDFDTFPCAGDAPAALLYSSGTTGRPKGIPLTHDNLASNALALAAAWGFGPGDVLLHALPVFHVHGLFIALGCVLMTGGQVLFESRFEARASAARFAQATVVMGVPTFYTRWLALPELDHGYCRNVRLFTCGSAPLLPDTWEAFHARTGQAILERYGMTETGVLTSNPLAGERRPGSVGRALPGVELRVVDANDRAVAPGTPGHVQVRGPGVFHGYWRNPARTRDDFTADGFFRTGDDGALARDGYLDLVGRAKDLIISGGLNVYPGEVEQMLDRAPGVLESAVVGLPHPDFGEQVVAVVVLRDGAAWDAAATRELLRSQLAPYKCPKHYAVVAELPRNAMGKVQKARLRETVTVPK